MQSMNDTNNNTATDTTTTTTTAITTTNQNNNNNNNSNNTNNNYYNNSNQNNNNNNNAAVLSTTTTRINIPILPQRGVLWKRRDVFKNSWRPRWFDLQPDHGLLTYYLLSSGSGSGGGNSNSTTTNNNNASNNNNTGSTNNTVATTVTESIFSTPSLNYNNNNTNNNRMYSRSQSTNSDSFDPYPTTTSQFGNNNLLPRDVYRSRSTSWDSVTSNVSENSIDYDVVPRGSIYLWGGGCTVVINDKLSKPKERLFAFTIRPSDQPPNTSTLSLSSNNKNDGGVDTTPIHLAARTIEMRDIWVRKIQQVCFMVQNHSNNNNNENGNNNTTTTTIPSPIRQQQGDQRTLTPISNNNNNNNNNNTLNQRRRGRSNSRGRSIGEPYIQRHEPIVEETNADLQSVNGGGGVGALFDNNTNTNNNDNDNDDFLSVQSGPTNTSPQRRPTTTIVRGPILLNWESDEMLCPTSDVYTNVPPTLAQQIRSNLQRYLALIDSSSTSSSSNDVANGTGGGWKLLTTRTKPEHKHLHVVAYQCDYEYDPITMDDGVTNNANNNNNYNTINATTNNGTTKKYTMVKSEAILPFPAKQVFHLISDATRRQQYETNIRQGKRLQKYNYHTYIDYYASMAVWPTAAREFVVAFHWQVLTRNDGEKAIAVISFSCPDADACRPTTPDHVRATLIVGMSLIRDMGDDKCHLTRLLSFDLGGNVPQHLSNTVMKQQANLSVVLYDFLQKHEPSPFENRFRSSELLSNQDVIRSVFEKPLQQINDEPAINGNGTITEEEIISKHDMIIQQNKPNVTVRALVLLLPVALHRLVIMFEYRDTGLLLFIVTAFLAIRKVVLWDLKLYQPADSVNELVAFGTVRYHFSVDLKGVLRFIANKKEEREELSTTSPDVSIIHLVTAAVARALTKDHGLNYRRVWLPWLFIDELVDASSEPVDVSILENGSESNRYITVQSVDRLDVQTIANNMARLKSENSAEETLSSIGKCLVVMKAAIPTEESESTIEMDLRPLPESGIIVIATLGDVTLDRRSSKLSKGYSSPQTGIPRPVLSLSLTILPAAKIRFQDIDKCRRYAEEVKKLLQFPELCDLERKA